MCVQTAGGNVVVYSQGRKAQTHNFRQNAENSHFVKSSVKCKMVLHFMSLGEKNIKVIAYT